ncbi:glycosyltransferase WbuB [Acinetobacter haemolyticus]|uniref:glycosyltransferase family 4 protein n=1 Tax=Acinetobacter TaxID=469 RepID=UPI000C2409F2|nr:MULTISPECIES: glycosyltransferase family 4 protein [Acinetobacter]PJI34513.1 glycosyltransferase WbuB [Acinetobacter pseudolwoffii]QHI28058.1 glycosyltransferase WbuB [Acinetobacter haemolyticus]
MRILYFHQYFNTPDMSGGTRSYEMARRLVAAGHEVHIITSWLKETDEKTWFTTVEAGIHVHWFPNFYNNKMSYAERVKAFFRFAYHATKKGKSLEADLVFATSTPLTIAIPAIFTARSLKVPMVFEVRDLWPELPIAMGALNNKLAQKLAYQLEDWAYKNSSSIVALSPGMKDGIVKTGYPKERVAIIPNSSDNELFTIDPELAQKFRDKYEWLQDRPLIVYTGTFGHINGVGYLVEVAEQLKQLNPEIRILLVGDGIEFEKVELLAKEKAVLNVNLFMMKQMPKKQIPVVLNAATLCTALFIDKPEMRANSANKFFDALAASTPILINYGGWMVDLIERNQCGLVTWNKSTDQAAKEIVSLIADENRLNEYALNAKKLAMTQFNRDELAAQLNKVLQLTLDQSSLQPEDITRDYYA